MTGLNLPPALLALPPVSHRLALEALSTPAQAPSSIWGSCCSEWRLLGSVSPLVLVLKVFSLVRFPLSAQGGRFLFCGWERWLSIKHSRSISVGIQAVCMTVIYSFLFFLCTYPWSEVQITWCWHNWWWNGCHGTRNSVLMVILG